MYTVCVSAESGTQTLHSCTDLSISVLRTPNFKVLGTGTKLTGEDKGLAWCTLPCEGPSLLDSGNLQSRAYCKNRFHSIPGHRCHTRHCAFPQWQHSSAEAPVDSDALSLAGPSMCQRWLTHIWHTRPVKVASSTLSGRYETQNLSFHCPLTQGRLWFLLGSVAELTGLPCQSSAKSSTLN
jgi:hypothetical protein